MKKKYYTKLIAIRIDKETNQNLINLSDSTGKSQSKVIRDLIRTTYQKHLKNNNFEPELST